MPNLKPMEILLIVLVVLLLFGAKRLPDLARSVGKSLKILKTEVKDLGDDKPGSATASGPTADTPTVSTPPAVGVPPSATATPPHGDPVVNGQAADDPDRKRV
ncbi:Sec-independent protein translocase subunit TatA [Cellulomonas fimi]|uniref:Sec-independent protein translocase protein TatA n=1 Tax=Cellulomonas fimi TaxID=1708 RepID=A0A7Y0M0W4_CELFI|nr:Sec-independent protein translocase subunit TatA [Cellulomonas fimi]NMR21519.1 Sec-independent protein translocase subunit TatA [Cellulomonas fimi]